MEVLEKKYNTYGLLITVSSLFMVIIYTGGDYDGWDVIIAFFAAMFGFSYLKDKMPIDWFSCFVASFIFISSVSSLVFAISQISGVYNFRPILDVKVVGFDVEIYFVALISLLISIFIKPSK